MLRKLSIFAITYIVFIGLGTIFFFSKNSQACIAALQSSQQTLCFVTYMFFSFIELAIFLPWILYLAIERLVLLVTAKSKVDLTKLQKRCYISIGVGIVLLVLYYLDLVFVLSSITPTGIVHILFLS